MAGEVSLMARRAFQQNHFLVVDAGPIRLVGDHQVRPLVDDDREIRTVGENQLPKEARVEDLAGGRYLKVPRLFEVKARGLVDISRRDGVMYRLAALCSAIMHRSDENHASRWRSFLGAELADSFEPVMVTEFMRVAKSISEAVPGTALSMEMSDGTVFVTSAEIGAQIYVEMNADDPARGPQSLFTNGMYTCEGEGPVHLIGGAEVLVVSRSGISFKDGTHGDGLLDKYRNSGMPESAIEEMRMRITHEDSTVVFLHRDAPEDALPIPEHGVMMRAVEGAVGVWEGDRLIHVLHADNGTTILCHPEASVVQLMATTDTARVLKIPFKLH